MTNFSLSSMVVGFVLSILGSILLFLGQIASFASELNSPGGFLANLTIFHL